MDHGCNRYPRNLSCIHETRSEIRLVGRNAINFTTVASAPNSSDLEGGRRTGNFEDYCNFLRLTQGADVIDWAS